MVQAVSSFYHTAADLNVSDGGSLADFRRAADRVCALEWHQVARLPLTGRYRSHFNGSDRSCIPLPFFIQ